MAGQTKSLAPDQFETECGVQKSVARFGPDGRLFKILALSLMSLLNFGSYFIYDTPAALEDQLLEEENLTPVQYGLFYSVYDWPNVILTFLGGYLIDRYLGVRLGSVLFLSLVTIGHMMFGVGAMMNTFWLMVLGRFVYALGGETCYVARNTYCVKWCKSSELNLLLGLQLSVARLGSVINMYSMVPLHDAVTVSVPGYRGLGLTIIIGGLSVVLSLACGLLLSILDQQRDNFLAETAVSDSCTASKERITWRDITKFGAPFWLLCITSTLYGCAVFPFVGYGQVYFASKFGFSDQVANTCNSLIYLVSIGLSPVMGYLIDRFGRNLSWGVLSVLLGLLAHSLLACTFINPFVPMMIFGVAYTMQATSLWSSVAFFVPEHTVSTAFGLLLAVQDTALAAYYPIIGAIVNSKGYLVFNLTILGTISITCCTLVLLIIVDSRHGGVINMDSKSRKEKLDVERKLAKLS